MPLHHNEDTEGQDAPQDEGVIARTVRKSRNKAGYVIAAIIIVIVLVEWFQ